MNYYLKLNKKMKKNYKKSYREIHTLLSKISVIEQQPVQKRDE